MTTNPSRFVTAGVENALKVGLSPCLLLDRGSGHSYEAIVVQAAFLGSYGRGVDNGLSPSRVRPDRLIAYGTSKSAVIRFFRNCDMAFGPAIRINCVEPSLIDTDMTMEMRDRIIAATPVARVSKPENVAELTYFFLSDAAGFITGQTYVASGGIVTLP